MGSGDVVLEPEVFNRLYAFDNCPYPKANFNKSANNTSLTPPGYYFAN
jgi:hypothetical protein